MTQNLYAPNAELSAFYDKFKELDAIYQENPTPSEPLANTLRELDQLISELHHRIPDEFIRKSEIINKAIHMISLITPQDFLLFHRLTFLLVYLLQLSDEAIILFCQFNPKDYIIQLFQAPQETLPQLAFCLVKNLIRTETGKTFLIESNLVGGIFEITSTQLNAIPPHGAFHKDNLKFLLLSIIQFTTEFGSDLDGQQIGPIIGIVSFLFSHSNTDISDIQIISLRLLLHIMNKENFGNIFTPEIFTMIMNHMQNPELANDVLIFAIKVDILAKQINSSDNSVMDLIPFPNAVAIFQQTEDPRLIQNLMTLFTNGVPFKPELIEMFASADGLAKLGQLIEMENSDIQQTTVWCVWNLLRYGTSEQMCLILNATQLMELVVDISFLSDDFNFWLRICIPSIIDVCHKLTDLNFRDQAPYAEFLTLVRDSLVEMEEGTENVEIKSLASSCLKISFPQNEAEE